MRYQPQFVNQWIALFKEMKELDNVSFERCLTADKAVDPPMLCVFADASQEAFGACAYLRQRKDDNTYSVKFIAAKVPSSTAETAHDPAFGATSSRSRNPPSQINSG